MSEWKKIKISSGHAEEQSSGVSSNRLISPFDVPIHMRVKYSKKSEKIIIELRYISEEPTKSVGKSKSLNLIVGKNSGRCYGIEVNVHSYDIGSTSLSAFVKSVLERELSGVKTDKKDKKSNFKLARKAFQEAQSEVFYDQLVQA